MAYQNINSITTIGGEYLTPNGYKVFSVTMVPGYNILKVVARNDVRAAGLIVSVYNGGTIILHTGLRVITCMHFADVY